MPLNNNMPRHRINHHLLLAQPQLRAQLIPQRLDAPINLLHACEGQGAAALAEQVDGQLVGRRARDEVSQIRGAELGREGCDGRAG